MKAGGCMCCNADGDDTMTRGQLAAAAFIGGYLAGLRRMKRDAVLGLMCAEHRHLVEASMGLVAGHLARTADGDESMVDAARAMRSRPKEKH